MIWGEGAVLLNLQNAQYFGNELPKWCFRKCISEISQFFLKKKGAFGDASPKTPFSCISEVHFRSQGYSEFFTRGELEGWEVAKKILYIYYKIGTNKQIKIKTFSYNTIV